MEWEPVLKQIEDHLFPRLRLTIRQRALYYHLLRHTRLISAESAVFALLPLANALDIAESTAREDLRDLHAKGCIRIEERSRVGHLVRVLLPQEIDGILVEAGPDERVDIESLDFFANRRFVDALLVRENDRCFYCLRSLRKETCQLDHVTPQVAAGDNSYRLLKKASQQGRRRGASSRKKGDGSGGDSSPFYFLLELWLHDRADRSCVANRVGEGTALAEQMRSAEGGWRGLFEVPFKRSSERNEFHTRAAERLSAVELQRLSRQERSGRGGVNPLRVRKSRVDG